MTVMKKRAECATLFARPRFRRGLGRCWFLLLLYDGLRQVSPFVFMKAIPKMVFTIGGKGNYGTAGHSEKLTWREKLTQLLNGFGVSRENQP